MRQEQQLQVVHKITMNGVEITSGGTALSDVATAIGSNVTNVTASVNSTTGNLEIFHNGKALGDSTGGANTIRFEASTGTGLADLGITAGVKNGVKLLQESHTNRPTWKTADENRPNGSVWFKTTSANSGAASSCKTLQLQQVQVSLKLLVHFMLHTTQRSST